MLRIFCRAKINGAVVTGKNLRYNGSIGIDRNIMDAADIMPLEQVQVLNINNGERLITYVIEEEAGSGKIVLYGPAARKGEEGDEVIILSYCMFGEEEKKTHRQITVKLKSGNKL